VLYASISLKSCFWSCLWTMRIRSWRGCLAVVVGLSFFASGQALHVYLWIPWFCLSIQRSKAAVCKLLLSRDQRGCFPQCLPLIRSHCRLSSWISARAGNAAQRGCPRRIPAVDSLQSSCPPRRAFFPAWLHAWRLLKPRHRSLG